MIDGRSHPINIVLLGGTTVNSSAGWSNDHQQLISTYQIKTKPGKDGELTIKRYLINGMKSEGVLFTLKLNGQPDEISARQIWNNQAWRCIGFDDVCMSYKTSCVAATSL